MRSVLGPARLADLILTPLIGLVDPDPFNRLPEARLGLARAAALLPVLMRAALGLVLQAWSCRGHAGAVLRNECGRVIKGGEKQEPEGGAEVRARQFKSTSEKSN